MKKLLLVGVAICVSAAFAEGVSTWKGASGTCGAAVWSADGNWTGGVPTGDATAVILRVNAMLPRVVLTPASDFTGTLILSNGVPTSGTLMAMRVALSNDVNSAWTVTGPGWLVATPGIAPRIGATFTGTLEVPKGVSLTLPATLNASVRIVGAGEVTLANADQINQALGFAGTVRVAGTTYEPTDITQIMSRSAALADGQTLNLTENTLALGGVHLIPGFEQPADWKIVGKTWAKGQVTPPYSDALPVPETDGTLKIVDDLAQTRVAIYQARRLRLQDSWGVSFTHIPALPADSRYNKPGLYQTWSGNFAFGLIGTLDPELPASGQYKSGICGYNGYYYRDNKDPRFQICNWGTGSDGMKESVLDGISMTKAIDVTVTCVDAFFTVTFVQGEKSFTLWRDYRTLLKDRPSGLYLAFSAASDDWNSATQFPWSTHTIKNFRGWYRNRAEVNWSAHKDAAKFVPVSADTWAVNTLDPVNHVTNDVTAIDANGDFLVKKIASSYKGNFHSKNKLSRDGRFLLSFDADVTEGEVKDASGSMTFGAVRWDSSHWMCTDRSGEWDQTWAQGWGGYWNFWQAANPSDKAKCLTLRNSITVNSTRSDVVVANYCDTPLVKLGSSAHIDYVYDAKGSLFVSVLMTNKTTGAGYARDYRQTLTADRWSAFREAVKNGLYFDFRATTGTWGNFAMKIRNLQLKEVSSNSNVPVNSPIAVDAGATATVSLGATDTASATPVATLAEVELGSGATLQVASSTASAKAAVGNVTASGAATLAVQSGAAVSLEGLTLSGEANASSLAVTGTATADELTVVVPSAWRKYRAGKVTLVSGLPVDPANVTLCDENGPIPEKKGNVVLENGVLKADFQRGMLLIFR